MRVHNEGELSYTNIEGGEYVKYYYTSVYCCCEKNHASFGLLGGLCCERRQLV